MQFDDELSGQAYGIDAWVKAAGDEGLGQQMGEIGRIDIGASGHGA